MLSVLSLLCKIVYKIKQSDNHSDGGMKAGVSTERMAIVTCAWCDGMLFCWKKKLTVENIGGGIRIVFIPHADYFKNH